MTTLITGANRGIGRALWERKSDALGTARVATRSMRELDVTDPASHSALAADLNERPIDLLICNAGVYLDKGMAFGDLTAAEWTDSFATNVTGVFLTIQTLLPNLRAAKPSKIAIISSIMATQTNAPGGAYAYRASKAAVLNLGRNLAQDLKSESIAVGIYHPGWVRSDMGSDAADISVEESAEGLIDRFNELDMNTTGCFKSYDGTELAF